MRVSGLDISLTSTGVAIVDDTAAETIRTTRVRSEPANRADGLKPDLEQRSERITGIRRSVLRLIGDSSGSSTGGPILLRMPDLVVIEGPSYASPQGAHEIGWNWGSIVDMCRSAGIPVVEVSPPQVKQYATGSGATSGKNKVEKHHVIAAVRANYGDQAAHITSSDEADALILAAIGCRYLGHPIESAALPPENLRALKKIRWPERKLV